MAGVSAVVNSLLDKELPLCQDGSLIEPLDALFLLYKNKGRNVTGGANTCFIPDRFHFPLLRNLLPGATLHFTPDDFVDSIVCLFITSVLVAAGMIMVKRVWEAVDPQFNSITPSHKKWYVVANLSKSFFLGCMAISSRYWIGTLYAYGYDIMENINTKRCGMMYISTDLVALLVVPKLPRSTKLHHITTILLIISVTTYNLEVKGFAGVLGVFKMAILYGIFSTMAYLVNAYLALRVVYTDTRWLRLLVKMSLWPYVLCCALNWTVHLVWMVSLIVGFHISVYNVLYFLTILLLVNDDIVLIKWLIKRKSPGMMENDKPKLE